MPSAYPGSIPQGLAGQAPLRNFLPHRRQVRAGIPGRLPPRLSPQSPSARPLIPSGSPPHSGSLKRQGQAHGVPPSSPISTAFLRRARVLCPPHQKHIPGGAFRFPPRVLRRSLWSRLLPTGAFFHSTVPSPHRPWHQAAAHRLRAARQTYTYIVVRPCQGTVSSRPHPA